MMKEETTYHIPVLLMPSVDAMNIRPDGTYVDVTFGGGGHSREILSRLEDGGRLLSFDQDEDAERNIVNNPHFTFVRSNFRYLHNFLRYHGIEKVDAILADLGVSSHHFDDSERGFSFRFVLGILYYARSNVSYLFGDSWAAQTAYKVLALVMLFIGGLAAYTIVWDLGDVGVGLMTIFNLIALYPMAGEALASLKDYEEKRAKGVL